MTKRIVVGITGASGAVLAKRCIEVLAEHGIEVHLLASNAGRQTLAHECGNVFSDLSKLCHVTYKNEQIGATIASGSFNHDGMIIIPCSINTMSAIAHCHSSDLMSRAADVCLKEGRLLCLCVRETPLHKGHLKLMHEVAELGAIVYPPIPTFYTGIKTMQDMVDQTVGRILKRCGIENSLYTQWEGL